MAEPALPHVQLFSYGTLQQPEVQLATFGRVLTGRADALPGHRRTTVAIADPAVIALSGSAVHPAVVPTGEANDSVEGTAFDITGEELLAADAYEVDHYVRVEISLTSGSTAWVYLDRRAIQNPR